MFLAILWSKLVEERIVLAAVIILLHVFLSWIYSFGAEEAVAFHQRQIEQLLQSHHYHHHQHGQQQSPQQNNATLLRWISSRRSEDRVFFTDHRVLQQYTLAVLFLSTDGRSHDGTTAMDNAMTTAALSDGSHSWLRSDGWLIDKNECNWYGVECAARLEGDELHEQVVLGLNLSNNALNGTLPTHIGLLNNLSVLDLNNNNDLRGRIPSTIYSLTQLHHFRAANNKLEWTLPSKIGFLTNLKSLDLSHNKFIGAIPSELGLLLSLESLNLSSNRFYEPIPFEIGQLRNIQSLNLSHNVLTGTLSENMFKSMTQLSSLQLNNNYFEGKLPKLLLLLQQKDMDHDNYFDWSNNYFDHYRTGGGGGDDDIRRMTTTATRPRRNAADQRNVVDNDESCPEQQQQQQTREQKRQTRM